MPAYLILLVFVGIPLFEFWLLFTVGSLYLGFWGTIATIIATGLIGGSLARREGLRTLEHARHLVQTGQLPTDAMIDGLLILLAGGVLLTPGFLTDAIGFLLLIPPVRARVRGVLKIWFAGRIRMVHVSKGGAANGFEGFSAGMPPHTPPRSEPTADEWREGDWRDIPEDKARLR